jgi:hypothetical protein
MVLVPYVVAEVAPLRRNPVFLYFEDHFQRPNPFRPDIVVPVAEFRELKIDGIDAHVSQVYEWLPWVALQSAEVPADGPARKEWLAGAWGAYLTNESFELCEYGQQPAAAELAALFAV